MSDLATTVAARRLAIATAVNEAFFARHPEWEARYGAAGRARGLEDALFHIDFLVGAVRAASPEAFARYAGWVAEVLGARGMPAVALREHLELLEAELPEVANPDRDMARRCFAAARERLSAPPSTRPAGDPEDTVTDVYVQAALRGDRKAALGVAREALSRGWSARRVYGTLERAQRRVGELWARNQIGVADEHVATAVTQWVVAMLYGELTPPRPTRGRVLVTGVEGELHQLGARMLADLLELDGWEVRYLGTNTPAQATVRAVQLFRPDVVGLSATLLARLPATLDLARALLDAVQPAPVLIVGGQAFQDVDAAVAVGAQGVATDLASGLELVHRFAKA